MSSEFRKSEEAATPGLSDTEPDEEVFSESEGKVPAKGEKEVSAPPSTRTRAKRSKIAAKFGKTVKLDESSGYSSVGSPAQASKEFKDDQANKKKQAKARQREEASKTGADWQLDPSDPTLAVGTDDWRAAGERTGLSSFNSTRKDSARLPRHGSASEIVNNPGALEAKNGAVSIRAGEYGELATFLKVRYRQSLRLFAPEF